MESVAHNMACDAVSGNRKRLSHALKTLRHMRFKNEHVNALVDAFLQSISTCDRPKRMCGALKCLRYILVSRAGAVTDLLGRHDSAVRTLTNVACTLSSIRAACIAAQVLDIALKRCTRHDIILRLCETDVVRAVAESLEKWASDVATEYVRLRYVARLVHVLRSVCVYSSDHTVYLSTIPSWSSSIAKLACVAELQDDIFAIVVRVIQTTSLYEKEMSVILSAVMPLIASSQTACLCVASIAQNCPAACRLVVDFDSCDDASYLHMALANNQTCVGALKIILSIVQDKQFAASHAVYDLIETFITHVHSDNDTAQTAALDILVSVTSHDRRSNRLRFLHVLHDRYSSASYAPFPPAYKHAQGIARAELAALCGGNACSSLVERVMTWARVVNIDDGLSVILDTAQKWLTLRKGDITDLMLATPVDFRCPITLECMYDPVVASDGHTYERHAIEYHIRCGNGRSPLTRTPLSSVLFENVTLRGRILGDETERIALVRNFIKSGARVTYESEPLSSSTE